MMEKQNSSQAQQTADEVFIAPAWNVFVEKQMKDAPCSLSSHCPGALGQSVENRIGLTWLAAVFGRFNKHSGALISLL